MAGPGKCFLVTGPPGDGKTTLIRSVRESQSFKTQLKGEIRQGGERVGFEVTLEDRRAPLASVNTSTLESYRWPTVGKYKVDVASFEACLSWSQRSTDLFIIDEMGKMELLSSSFFPAVLRILESNIPVLASIPIPKLGRDIPAGKFT